MIIFVITAPSLAKIKDHNRLFDFSCQKPCYILLFYHLTSMHCFIPLIPVQFYHVTITFPAVVEQQDSSTISSFVFFTLYLLGL